MSKFTYSDIGVFIEIFNEHYNERFPLHALQLGEIISKDSIQKHRRSDLKPGDIFINILFRKTQKIEKYVFVLKINNPDGIVVSNNTDGYYHFKAIEKKLKKFFREYGNKQFIRKYKISKINNV